MNNYEKDALDSLEHLEYEIKTSDLTNAEKKEKQKLIDVLIEFLTFDLRK